ncbi:MAG: type IV secretory system conjugative DNA transfer family protein [Clostridia bacterium]|nr:type IV secretory system conjugative DNA transfer family protein [Clostridia bacterium]
MKQDKKALGILCLLGILPMIWLGLLIAPAMSEGLIAVIARFTEAMRDPFHIELCEDSLQAVLLLLFVYGLLLGIHFSTRRNYRRGEEHGSAKWGDAGAVSRKYRAMKPEENKLFTQHVGMGLDGRKHLRNLNTIVVGGSGAGKTRFYAKPNLCQANTSFVVLDPKGELLRDTGYLLEHEGYEVRVLDLLNMEKSHCYNPFFYLRDDNDVQRLVTNLFKSTTPKGSQTQDPFWDTAASMLLLALIFYLHHEAPPDEQNFPMVMEMLRAGEVREDDNSYQSPLDELFERLEMREPDHIAVKYYKDYHSGSAKTLKSIQITLAARLEKFNLESLASLTATDELELSSLGEKKVALFALIPDNDTSFNFLVSILYTQLFQQLFHSADHKYGGRLPVHVHFLMDEFANVSLPEDFDKILSVMRSREVSVSIILQNMAQIKALYEKQWESIVGNCDSFLYLGGNEQSTHKYVSELLGKATIDTNTYGKSTGRNGNYSTNFQITGRELLDAAEVRLLDNKNAILFIRGEKPVLDDKYDILKHPKVALTADGKAEPYQHGTAENAVATVSFAQVGEAISFEAEETETMYELLSDEELEEELKSQEEQNHVQQENH